MQVDFTALYGNSSTLLDAVGVQLLQELSVYTAVDLSRWYVDNINPTTQSVVFNVAPASAATQAQHVRLLADTSAIAIASKLVGEVCACVVIFQTGTLWLTLFLLWFS